MPLSVTNRSRRFYIFVVLWLRLVPLVFSFPHDSQKHKRHSSEAFRITNLPRGGGNDETRHQDESDDDEDRTRFWSLSALFRLNANAKDDASTSLATSHLDRGNRRGGALAVRTSKSKTFVDVTPVSTAASRLVSHEEDENMNDYDESIEPLTTDELRESEMIGVEGIEEETESSEESMMDEEEESDDQASAREVFEEDNGPEVDTPAQPIAGEFAEEDIASESEEQVSDADNMTGSDILRKIREDIAVDRDTEELTEILHRDVAVEVDEMAVSESSSYYTPSKAKEMIQDASKYWWNNVWTEQTSEEIPDLDELVSDESDPEVSMPEKNEVDEISSDTRIIDVDIQEIDMEEIEIQEPSEVVEPPPDLWMRQEPEIIPVDVQVIDEASAEGTTLGPDMTDSSLQQVEPPRKKESPFVSSGYVSLSRVTVSLSCSNESNRRTLDCLLVPSGAQLIRSCHLDFRKSALVGSYHVTCVRYGKQLLMRRAFMGFSVKRGRRRQDCLRMQYCQLLALTPLLTTMILVCFNVVSRQLKSRNKMSQRKRQRGLKQRQGLGEVYSDAEGGHETNKMRLTQQLRLLLQMLPSWRILKSI